MLHCGYAYFAGFSAATVTIWEFMVNTRTLRFSERVFGRNIGFLIDLACIFVKWHASLGFCGKILNLYIVKKTHVYLYIDLQKSKFVVVQINCHFFP